VIAVSDPFLKAIVDRRWQKKGKEAGGEVKKKEKEGGGGWDEKL